MQSNLMPPTCVFTAQCYLRMILYNDLASYYGLIASRISDLLKSKLAFHTEHHWTPN